MNDKCLVAMIIIVILIMMTMCPKKIEGMVGTTRKYSEERPIKIISLNDLKEINFDDNKLVNFIEHKVDNNILKPGLLKNEDGKKLSGTTDTVFIKCSLPNLDTGKDTDYLLARLSPLQCKREIDVGCQIEIPVLIPYKKLFEKGSLNNVIMNTRFNVLVSEIEDDTKYIIIKGVEGNSSSSFLSTKAKDEQNIMCMDISNEHGKFIIENWGLGYRLRNDTIVPDPKDKTKNITRKMYVSLCNDGPNSRCNTFSGIKRLCNSDEPDNALSFKFITFKRK